MKIIHPIIFIIVLLPLLSSCKKDKNNEDNLPSSYFDYDKFITNGLIAYYPFNGNVNDYSGNGLNGIANNVSYSADRFDKLNGACYLNGTNSYVTINNSSILNDTAYTICFWYRADMTDTLRQSIISKSDSLGYGYTFDLYNTSQSSIPGFSYREVKTDSIWYNFPYMWTNFSYFNIDQNNSYVLIILAFSPKKMIYYNIGTTISNPDPTRFIFNKNNCNLYIGKSENKHYSNYKGYIDDLLIYNRILTFNEAQILANWNKTK